MSCPSNKQADVLMTKAHREAIGYAAKVAHKWAVEQGLRDDEANDLRDKIRSLR